MINEDDTTQIALTANLGHELLKLGWQLRLDANKAFENLDITPVKVIMLSYIARGGIQPKQLTKALGIQFSATSTLLSQLGKQGLVNRLGNVNDHRYVNLELTSKGRQMLQDAEKAWQQNSTLNVSALTEGELITLTKFCQIMIVPL